MNRERLYPFAAVVGQEEAKEALLMALINPRVQGVLLSGEKGTAKSSLVRSLSTLDEAIKIVEVPLNITEDRLAGGIDLERMLKKGEKVLQPGVLAQAHGHVLYIDEVNLLPSFLVKKILDAAATGINRVEREGISFSHPSQFVLIGTMNPEEGNLSPQFLDRFGLYVEVKGLNDEKMRLEIIKRRLAFEENPAGFYALWQGEGEKIAQRLKMARSILPEITVGEEILALAAELSRRAGSQGHRGELVTVECARALAAWEGRKKVTPEDVKKAALYALCHRQSPKPKAEPERPENGALKKEPQKNDIQESTDEAKTPPPGRQQSKKTGQARERKDAVDEIVLATDIIPFSTAGTGGKGKGNCQKSNKGKVKRGRYTGWTYPRRKDLTASEVALDATLRAAALSQVRYSRKEGKVSLIVKPEDLREKVRENPPQRLLVFVVDASGSMGARARMGAVKGAIISLLKEAYRKRYQIALLTFRQDCARLLLPPTSSPERAQSYLAELATGGKTPLAEGLYLGLETIEKAWRKNKNLDPVLILVSDGRSNWAKNGENPMEIAMEAALALRKRGLTSLVLDTEEKGLALGLAQRLAEAMGARYVRLEEVSQRAVRHYVAGFLQELVQEGHY